MMDLNRIEEKALWEGGIKTAGQYLDELGETDLSKLSKEQMLQFGELLLSGYGQEMKERLKTEPPF